MPSSMTVPIGEKGYDVVILNNRSYVQRGMRASSTRRRALRDAIRSTFAASGAPGLQNV